jgi:hypothetical protein
MKIIWIIWLAIVSSSCFAGADSSSDLVICNQPYALCTTAPCTPIPGTKNQSICSCVVENGPSLGQTSCDKRKPSISSTGQQLLTSNYSFENSATNKVMTCKGNHAWTNCLDKPCIIDPQNSNQATCMCGIEYSENFLTFGGQCNTASCTTTLYSGATQEMVVSGTQALMKALHLTKSPMQSCPAS